MKRADIDFRQTFARMAPQAIVTREELASLLATTVGALAQMAYRGELPQTAFPAKRRACWFAGDIRQWLDDIAARRPVGSISPDMASIPEVAKPRIGRPRVPSLDGR